MPLYRPNAVNPVSVVSKTSAYTLTSSDDVVLANTSGGAFTLTLPTAVGFTKALEIRLAVSGSLLTIATTSAQTMGGLSSLQLGTAGDIVAVVSDGTNWQFTVFTVRCGARYSNANAFTSGPTVPAYYDAKEFDTHNAVTVSTTAWRFTAPFPGLYEVKVHNVHASALEVCNTFINGGQYAVLAWPDGTYKWAHGTDCIQLNTGDYFDMRYGTSCASTANGQQNYISIARVG